jgi:hypothetical protein
MATESVNNETGEVLSEGFFSRIGGMVKWTVRKVWNGAKWLVTRSFSLVCGALNKATDLANSAGSYIPLMGGLGSVACLYGIGALLGWGFAGFALGFLLYPSPLVGFVAGLGLAVVAPVFMVGYTLVHPALMLTLAAEVVILTAVLNILGALVVAPMAPAGKRWTLAKLMIHRKWGAGRLSTTQRVILGDLGVMSLNQIWSAAADETEEAHEVREYDFVEDLGKAVAATAAAVNPLTIGASLLAKGYPKNPPLAEATG